MPRKPRVQYPGAIYHVSIQANRSEALFLSAPDYQTSFAYLSRVCDLHELQLHAWCAMTTHYHLLVTTPNGDLARAIHRLNSRYAHWFNDAHGEVGHVHRRRYTSVLVERDEHLKWLYRYIGMNPVTAGACASPERWRWSSFAWLYGGFTWRLDPPSDEIHLLRHWGEGDEARRRLRRYVETGIA